jgi:hypothetical protein
MNVGSEAFLCMLNQNRFGLSLSQNREGAFRFILDQTQEGWFGGGSRFGGFFGLTGKKTGDQQGPKDYGLQLERHRAGLMGLLT